jgi:hypothetical protein
MDARLSCNISGNYRIVRARAAGGAAACCGAAGRRRNTPPPRVVQFVAPRVASTLDWPAKRLPVILPPFRKDRVMKMLLTVALVGACAFAAAPTYAAENAQQERMKTCNSKAGDMKGDERKKFMSECLSAEKKKSDSKMGECNTKSKGMKADERKKFMSDCMKA